MKKDPLPSPVTPSLGSLGESPELPLSSLLATPSPKKRKLTRTQQPSAAASKPPEEVFEPIREEPTQLPPKHAAPVEAPGPTQLDTAA